VETRASLLADRKGRQVRVERIGQTPPQHTGIEARNSRNGGRRGRRVSADRTSGPRPRHPRRPRGG
jgi:hypothetical protein